MAAPLLQTIEIKGKEITADALLTQREFARYLVYPNESGLRNDSERNASGVIGRSPRHHKHLRKPETKGYTNDVGLVRPDKAAREDEWNPLSAFSRWLSALRFG